MNISKSILLYAGFMLLALLALTGCGTTDTPAPASQPTVVSPEAVIAEGHVVPKDFLYLSFPVRGKVTEILVKNGDSIREGQVLIRLGDREQAEAALLAAQTELTAAQQAFDDFNRLADLAHAQAWGALLEAQTGRGLAQQVWDELDLTDIDERIDEAEAEVNDMRQALNDAQEEFDKYKDLGENNASRVDAKEALDQAEQDYNEALRTLEETQREKELPRARLDEALAAETEALRDFNNTLDGPDTEQLTLLESRLKSSQAQVTAAESTLANFEITAPFDGTVVDINLSINEMTGPESWAVLVANLDQWYVETSDLSELEVVDLSLGQQASIVADALPDQELTGTVTEIGQNFYQQGGDILYRVKLHIADPDPHLMWGMTVEITFQTE